MSKEKKKEQRQILILISFAIGIGLFLYSLYLLPLGAILSCTGSDEAVNEKGLEALLRFIAAEAASLFICWVLRFYKRILWDRGLNAKSNRKIDNAGIK